MILLYIAAGGAAGALARYGLGGWIQDRAGFGFPWGTLVVNVLGSLLMGLAIRYLEATRLAPDLRALITIGILGAFTTFSTFTYETVTLLENGAWARAGAYAFGSLLLGIAAIYAGMTWAGHLMHARV
jgi:fluoride exporter